MATRCAPICRKASASARKIAMRTSAASVSSASCSRATARSRSPPPFRPIATCAMKCARASPSSSKSSSSARWRCSPSATSRDSTGAPSPESFHGSPASPIPTNRRGRQRLPSTPPRRLDRKSTRLNSSHANISYAVFCLIKNNFEREAVLAKLVGHLHVLLLIDGVLGTFDEGQDVAHPFFFNDTATTEIYTLSLHDALPISDGLPPSLRRHCQSHVRDSWPNYTSHRKSTRLNSSHANISYAVFCVKRER